MAVLVVSSIGDLVGPGDLVDAVRVDNPGNEVCERPSRSARTLCEGASDLGCDSHNVDAPAAVGVLVRAETS